MKERDDNHTRMQVAIDDIEKLRADLRDAQILLVEKQNMIDKLLTQGNSMHTNNHPSPLQLTAYDGSASQSCANCGSREPLSVLQTDAHGGILRQPDGSTVFGGSKSYNNGNIAAANFRAERVGGEHGILVEKLKAQLARAVTDLKRMAAERARLVESGNALRAELRWVKEGFGATKVEKGTQSREKGQGVFFLVWSSIGG